MRVSARRAPEPYLAVFFLIVFSIRHEFYATSIAFRLLAWSCFNDVLERRRCCWRRSSLCRVSAEPLPRRRYDISDRAAAIRPQPVDAARFANGSRRTHVGKRCGECWVWWKWRATDATRSDDCAATSQRSTNRAANHGAESRRLALR